MTASRSHMNIFMRGRGKSLRLNNRINGVMSGKPGEGKGRGYNPMFVSIYDEVMESFCFSPTSTKFCHLIRVKLYNWEFEFLFFFISFYQAQTLVFAIESNSLSWNSNHLTSLCVCVCLFWVLFVFWKPKKYVKYISCLFGPLHNVRSSSQMVR